MPAGTYQVNDMHGDPDGSATKEVFIFTVNENGKVVKQDFGAGTANKTIYEAEPKVSPIAGSTDSYRALPPQNIGVEQNNKPYFDLLLKTDKETGELKTVMLLGCAGKEHLPPQ